MFDFMFSLTKNNLCNILHALLHIDDCKRAEANIFLLHYHIKGLSACRGRHGLLVKIRPAFSSSLDEIIDKKLLQPILS